MSIVRAKTRERVEAKVPARAIREDNPASRSVLARLLDVNILRRLASITTLVLTDALTLFAGIGIAGYLLGEEHRATEALPYVPVFLVVWVAVFAAFRLYDEASLRRDPLALLKAVAVSFGLVLVGSTAYPRLDLDLTEILIAAAVTLTLVGGTRYLYELATKSLYVRSLGQTRALLVGDGAARERVREASEQSPGSYIYVGELAAEDNGVNLRAFRRELDLTQARQVVIAGAERLPERNFIDLIRSCRLRKVEVNVVPGAVALVGGRLSFSQEVGVPLLRVEYPALDNHQRVLKRGLDVFGSILGLVALSPLLLLVAVAIKLTSSGPVLFAQRRVGVDEKVFCCYKFRSMYRDAEQRQKEFEALNEVDGAIFKMRNDPRVTLVGRFIRRFSIDELPQLLNVLRGDMSLVGPRPLPVRDFELMSEEHKRRLGAMPGLTGYWQISGRSELSFEEMVRLDLYYIENWSLSFDVKIIVRTVGTVLRQDGAY